MAKWFYKKYDKGYSAWSAERLLSTSKSSSGNDYMGYNLLPSWNGNGYTPNGTRTWRPWHYSSVFYNIGVDKELERSYLRVTPGSDIDEWTTEIYINYHGRTRTIVAGTYVGEVIAEDGTYPANGLHSDGFWYVRDRQAFPEMWVNINGTQRKCEEGWVNINGTWRAIEEIYVNINGTWRKSE